MKRIQFKDKVIVMCNEDAKKFDMLPTWTLQSGPKRSRKVVCKDDPYEAPVFNFVEKLICPQIEWKRTVGVVVE